MHPLITQVEQAGRTVGRRIGQAWLLRCAVAAVLGLGVAIAVDALIALPDPARPVVLPVLVVATIVALGTVLFVWRRWRPSAEQVSRTVENARGDRDHSLTAALQLARHDGELAQAAVTRWSRNWDAQTIQQYLPRGFSRRALWVALAMLLTAGIVQLAQPRLLPTVWTRLWDARGDHPPFASSVLRWADAAASVRVGGHARFTVQVDGPAKDCVLVARDAAGQLTRVRCFAEGDGRFTAELDRVDEPLTVWIEAGGTRTTRRLLVLDPIPELRSLVVTLRQPDYARLPVEEKTPGSGGRIALAALPAATLSVQPVANRPLAAVRLRSANGDEQRLELTNGLASAPAPLGVLSVILEATDGVLSDAVATVTIDELADRPPRAVIAAPARDGLATRDSVLPLAFVAEDDLGLNVVHRSGGVDQLTSPELTANPDARQWRRERQLALADLGVVPGQTLLFRVIARDSRPEGQWSVPAERQIAIISDEEYNRLLQRRLGPDALQKKYGELLRDLKALDREMRAMKDQPRNAQENAEWDAKMKEFAAKADSIAKRTQALRRKTPLYAIEPDLQDQIEKAARALEEAAKSGKPGSVPPGAIAEQLAQDLDLLTQAAKAQALVARLRQLIDAEQNTTDRLQPFAEHRRLGDGERVRLRQLGDDEATIAESLDSWRGLAETLALDLRKDDADADSQRNKLAEQLMDLAHAVHDTNAAELKRRSAQACRTGDGLGGHQLAAEARDRLLKLLQKCSSSSGSCTSLALSLSWCSGIGASNTLGGLSFGAGMGWGLGGSGSAGMGLALGYGGDDSGASQPSDAMDLIGPESFASAAGGEGNGQDAIAGLATGVDGPVHAAAAYRREVRTTTAAERTALDAEQQQLVDDYFRLLETAP